MSPFTTRAGRAQLRLRGTLPIVAATLLSCAQPHNQQQTVAVLPAVAYEAHITAGESAAPGGSLRNPHAGDTAVARNGALLFTAMNCDGCHGGDATGWVGPNLGDGRWHLFRPPTRYAGIRRHTRRRGRLDARHLSAFAAAAA